ncbi:MAG TPA: aminodeoxychorismate synthase component I, partial [Candidatus Gracilibacteria bacterium]|nr:aminodeoxychorismate synthase component I [Candidatus Gracilibacteria bacterium]
MPPIHLSSASSPFSEDSTPESFFDRLRGDYAFLLRSGEEKGRHDNAPTGRYSYIGYDPFLIVESDGNTVHLTKRKDFFSVKKSARKRMVEGNPVQVLRDLMGTFVYKGAVPVPFTGGAAGYFSYDFGCRLAGVEQRVFDDAGIPDFCFAFTDKLVAFDHEARQIFFLGLGETTYSAAEKVKQIQRDVTRSSAFIRSGELGNLSSNMTKNQYIKKVLDLKEYLKRGESYQVNFSQRFSAKCTKDPWSLFKKLSASNPSPFSSYFQYPDFSIVSSSPELLLRKRKNLLETWPIKGTVRRGRNSREDAKLEKELLASAKDTAELAMIVDLERNDLGKVCRPGSVKVIEHRQIQKYAHVIHTVSKVSGELDRNKDALDVFEAMFPGGSITGCPKKRTMEIIDHLEDFKRGVYTGSAGYFSFNGDADFNILIRTMLLKDNKVLYNVGGGGTIDSDPGAEYEETLQKAES